MEWKYPGICQQPSYSEHVQYLSSFDEQNTTLKRKGKKKVTQDKTKTKTKPKKEKNKQNKTNKNQNTRYQSLPTCRFFRKKIKGKIFVQEEIDI